MSLLDVKSIPYYLVPYVVTRCYFPCPLHPSQRRPVMSPAANPPLCLSECAIHIFEFAKVERTPNVSLPHFPISWPHATQSRLRRPVVARPRPTNRPSPSSASYGYPGLLILSLCVSRNVPAQSTCPTHSQTALDALYLPRLLSQISVHLFRPRPPRPHSKCRRHPTSISPIQAYSQFST